MIKDPGREYHSVDKKVTLPPSATSLYCIWQQIKAGMRREKKNKTSGEDYLQRLAGFFTADIFLGFQMSSDDDDDDD